MRGGGRRVRSGTSSTDLQSLHDIADGRCENDELDDDTIKGIAQSYVESPSAAAEPDPCRSRHLRSYIGAGTDALSPTSDSFERIVVEQGRDPVLGDVSRKLVRRWRIERPARCVDDQGEQSRIARGIQEQLRV